MQYIKDYLNEYVPIAITPNLAAQLIRMVMSFEIYQEHPLTLNSQMFGVSKFAFTGKDRQLFFDILGCDEKDVADTIRKIPSINDEFKVISDPFNIMSVYVSHLILTSDLRANLKHDSVISVLNYMQYRFIGSAVNHYFPHGANSDVMQTVVETLNLKFSVRQLGSWKGVVVERSESLAYDTKSHYSTLEKFTNDKDILYLISDTSTRIRSQLKIITSEYYSMKETNNFITSHSSTTSLDGEKILRERHSSFESISSSVYDKVIIKSSFIDERYLKMVQVSVPRLNIGIIRRLLSTISDEARHQIETNTTMKIVKRRDGVEIYEGIEVLINNTIHVIYSSAVRNDKVNLNSKISVYTNVRNIFSAARSANPQLVNIRASLDDLIRRTHISSRDSTISGLTVSLALFLTLLSFSSI